MIIITKKLHPRRLVAGCALFALALGVLGAGLGLVRDIQSAAAVADLQVDPRGIKTNADRVAFLEGLRLDRLPGACRRRGHPPPGHLRRLLRRVPVPPEIPGLRPVPSTPAKPSNAIPIRSPTTPVYRKISGPVFSSIKKRSSAGRSTPTRGTASSRPCPIPPNPKRPVLRPKTAPPAVVIPRRAAFLHFI